MRKDLWSQKWLQKLMSSYQPFRGFFCLAFFFALGLVCLLASPVAAKEKTDDEVSGKESILFEGKESDDVKIRKGITIIGSSPAKATINGDVTMENGSTLKNVTVNAKVIGITVEKGASVVLENVTVRGASDAGLFAKEGGGTLTIRNSRIIKNRKGFYILPGKNLAIVGNLVSENSEEGLDIRQKVSGTVSRNTFSQNREGGAEVIIGGSSLTISGNTFTGNRASGLALQTYSNATGASSVVNNRFSGNGNYGIDCKNTMGDGSMGTFRSSVSVRENTFAGNTQGNINGACQLFNVARIAEEAEVVPAVPFEEEPSRIKEVRLERLAGEVASVEAEVKKPWDYWKSFRYFSLGTDREYFAVQRENIRRLEEQLSAFKIEKEVERLTEINALIPGKIIELEERLLELSHILEVQGKWTPL